MLLPPEPFFFPTSFLPERLPFEGLLSVLLLLKGGLGPLGGLFLGVADLSTLVVSGRLKRFFF